MILIGFLESEFSHYAIFSWHILMLNDKVRNEAFTDALRSKLSRPRSVIDLGSGTGLLGIAADQIGATNVTLVEFNNPIAEMSQSLAEANEGSGIAPPYARVRS